MKNWIYLMLLVCLMVSCSVEPEPIHYGNDKCDNCTMTIVDKPYGTELVTEKGKVFKFDSTECMLNYMNENEASYAYQLTNTMDQPGELIDAKTSYYLVSENLPSPMGANITAFSTKGLAEEAQAKHDGNVYNFDELKNNFSKEQVGGTQPHSH